MSCDIRRIKPIELLVSVSFTSYDASTSDLSTWWSSTALIGIPCFEMSFPLEMLSAVISSIRSYPAMPRARQLVHQRYVHPGPLVLRTASLKYPTPMADRDRTVSRRSEPSSRTSLNGEQPYPWDLLQPQDEMSRHRGAKPCRRCGRLGRISLLSPEYLLFVERWPFLTGPPDHYDRLSSLFDLSVSQSSLLMPLHSTVDIRPT